MTWKLGVILISATLLAGVALAQIPRTPSEKDTAVYFVALEENEMVKSPVLVRFGLRGMGVAPAGANLPKTGHHHLVIDAPLPPLDQPLPADDHNRHFGGGQTEAVLELPKGRHTLQLVLADYRHIPHDPPVISEPLTIVVE